MTQSDDDIRQAVRSELSYHVGWDRREPGVPYPWQEQTDWPARLERFELELALVEAMRYKRAAEAVADRIRRVLLANV